MVTATGPLPEATEAPSTIWGLTPLQLHDRFWVSRGVQVVRRGTTVALDASAELYLLVDHHSLVIFRLRDLVEILSWLNPQLVIVRLRDPESFGYREVALSGADGTSLQFQRIYDGIEGAVDRLGLTADKSVAVAWQSAASAAAGWRGLRQSIDRECRTARRMPGRVFDGSRPEEQARCVECLMAVWAHPDSTISRVRHGPAKSWLDTTAVVQPGARVVGPVWVGAGRTLSSTDCVVGPAVLWDEVDCRPDADVVRWDELIPLGLLRGPGRGVRGSAASQLGKRVFDVLFAVVALSVTAPLYPLIALAIMLEDGWPIFFRHRRESVGGREFLCLKFRSMRRDAERVKADLTAQNVADGPQFFVASDPRSTRVGAFLRKSQLDEIPQFWNVLVGDMSVVGPRPSPRNENQFCPAWREARLSVRPGVTGLWQIRRTRQQGLDFQEWIRFDLEYVQRMNWRLDLWIIWKTIGTVLRRALGR